MGDVVLVIDGVELREVGGEGTTVLEKAARMVVHSGPPPRVDVGKTAVPFKGGGASFSRLGDREFRFATDDVMTFLYVELPKGLPEAHYAAAAAVLDALAEGRPVPTPPPAAAAAAEGAAAAPPAAAAASAGGRGAAPGAGIGALFGALAAKAVHDTKALGEAIRQKAEHDMKLVQDEQAAAAAKNKAAAAAEGAPA